MTKNEECVEVKSCPTTTKKFTWRIENYSKIKSVLFSEPFMFEGYKWRMYIHKYKGGDLSFFVKVIEEATIPVDWVVEAFVRYNVIDQLDHNNSIPADLGHTFMAGDGACGYHSYLPAYLLHDKNFGYLLNDMCLVEVELSVPSCTYNHDEDNTTIEEKEEEVTTKTARAQLLERLEELEVSAINENGDEEKEWVSHKSHFTLP